MPPSAGHLLHLLSSHMTRPRQLPVLQRSAKYTSLHTFRATWEQLSREPLPQERTYPKIPSCDGLRLSSVPTDTFHNYQAKSLDLLPPAHQGPRFCTHRCSHRFSGGNGPASPPHLTHSGRTGVSAKAGSPFTCVIRGYRKEQAFPL